jgi:hypothetical protein
MMMMMMMMMMEHTHHALVIRSKIRTAARGEVRQSRHRYRSILRNLLVCLAHTRFAAIT